MTSPELTRKIYERFGLSFSREKVKRLRRKLGWVQTGAKYCQLIREPNRVKRLEFSEKCRRDNEQFDNVIFTDECSVMLENHSKISFHRKWEQPRLKGRPKHPIKVHVWAGISKRGPTRLIVFEGIMDAQFYISEILTNGLLPFIESAFPDGHRFQQDNDPKHTSRLAKTFMEENNINWWKTPPESPDLNPIELLWHELKHFLRSIVKPRTKEELMNGISRFWEREWMPRSAQNTSGTCKKCCQSLLRVREKLPAIRTKNGSFKSHYPALHWAGKNPVGSGSRSSTLHPTGQKTNGSFRSHQFQ